MLHLDTFQTFSDLVEFIWLGKAKANTINVEHDTVSSDLVKRIVNKPIYIICKQNSILLK